jgi:hypothetical protein
MTRQVLFNGAVLVRAGGATKIDASAYQNFGAGGVGVVGVIGEADGGEPNVAISFRDPQNMAAYFRTGALANAADLAFRPMNDPRVPGGASQVIAIKTNQSTQSAKTFNHSTTPEIVITSKDYGAHTNKIAVRITTSGTGKIIEIVFEDGATRYAEISPILGASEEFSILYTGAGSAATATITKTKLTTACTGAVGDNLDLDFATYGTLKELINAINTAAAGVYTAVAVTTNPYTFLCTDLDRVTAVDVKTAPGGKFKAMNFRMVDWVNKNSNWVSAVRATGSGAEGDVSPDATTTLIPLVGGARGISASSNWQTAYNALGKVRVNEIVPLASQDLTNEGYGSTATFAAIVAMHDAHCAYYSSTKGKSEREGYVGMAGTKTAVLAQAGALQSLHTILTAQKITRPDVSGNLIEMPEWAFAVVAAGGRAGSVLGEPLVYKTIRAYGLSQDASWSPEGDGDDMILGGVTFAFAPPEGGYKFDRVVSTYTKSDNDAYVEESVITGWKNVSYGLRSQLENIFTGVRGLPATVRSIKDAAGRILEGYRKENQIVDSILADGTVLQ